MFSFLPYRRSAHSAISFAEPDLAYDQFVRYLKGNYLHDQKLPKRRFLLSNGKKCCLKKVRAPHEEDSGSEQSITREDIERDKSSDFDDLSIENILRTPRKNKKRRIWQVNNNSGEESSAHESYDSSDVESSEEDTRVLIKSPQKKKHSAID